MSSEERIGDRLARLLAEGLQRLEGCAGDPCCDACEDYAERAKRALVEWLGREKE